MIPLSPVNPILLPVIVFMLTVLAACGGGGGGSGPAPQPTMPENGNPVVSISGSAGVTEGGVVEFTITASPAPTSSLPVRLTIGQNGNFVNAQDWGSKTVIVNARQASAVHRVPTVDDTSDEANGSVTARVVAGAGYTVAAPPGHTASVAVNDNDAAPLPSLWYETRNLLGVTWGSKTATTATVTITRGRTREYAEGRVCPGIPGLYPGIDYEAHWILRPAPASYPDRLGSSYPGIRGCNGGTRGSTSPDTGRLAISVGNSVSPGRYDAAVHYTLVSGRKELSITVVVINPLSGNDADSNTWLTQFGGTVADQVLDGIGGQIGRPRTPGIQGAISGQAVGGRPGGTGTEWASAASSGEGTEEPAGPGNTRAGSGQGHGVLANSHFTLTGRPDAGGGTMAFWGQGARVAPGSKTATGMLGMDYVRGKWLIGLALAQSASESGHHDSHPNLSTAPAGDRIEYPPPSLPRSAGPRGSNLR